MELVHTHFTVKILFDYSTGFDEIGNYFATEAIVMVDILYY